jgi:hypothetical protein
MRVLMACLALAAASCGAGRQEPEVVSSEAQVDVEGTEVEATVVAYHEGMLQVERDDGSLETFDATELEVVSPEALTGKRLYICHSPPAAEGSVWRAGGTTIRFELAEKDLDPVGCAYVSDEEVEVLGVVDE